MCCPALPLAGSARGYELLSQDDNTVNCMIWNALSPVVPADYTPPCYGVVMVIVIPCNENGGVSAQINIAQVPVPVPCDCAVSAQLSSSMLVRDIWQVIECMHACMNECLNE